MEGRTERWKERREREIKNYRGHEWRGKGKREKGRKATKIERN